MPRIIYSLEFDLEPDDNGASRQLIAPLTPDGQSPHCEALEPIRRVVDLRAGNEVWHEPTERAYRVLGVRAYRENTIPDEQLVGGLPKEGYVVRSS